MGQSLSDTEKRFRSDLLSWADENLRDFPWREPDRSFYEVFVAEFFLTQTPAENVADVYPRFLQDFPSLTAIRSVDRSRIKATIEPLGFQRMRTDALTSIAANYEELPGERDELLSLQRVGPYVADATLCFGAGEPRPIVDRNVVRVYDRVFRSSFPDGDADRREFAARLLPDGGDSARRYNLGLLDFGALVCEKRSPNCDQCFASTHCEYYRDVVGV